MSEPQALTDRAYNLLHAFLAVGIQPANNTDGEQLAREAVRWCRALESEVEEATERPEPEKKARPKSQRPVGPQREEEDEEEGWDQ